MNLKVCDWINLLDTTLISQQMLFKI